MIPVLIPITGFCGWREGFLAQENQLLSPAAHHRVHDLGSGTALDHARAYSVAHCGSTAGLSASHPLPQQVPLERSGLNDLLYRTERWGIDQVCLLHLGRENGPQRALLERQFVVDQPVGYLVHGQSDLNEGVLVDPQHRRQGDIDSCGR